MSTFYSKALDQKIDKESLKTIQLDDLNKFKVCPGQVFYFTKSDFPVLLLRAGDEIDPSWIERYKKKGVENLNLYEVADSENFADIKKLFEQLKNKDSLENDLESIYKVKKWFAEVYYSGTQRGSLLDLIIIGKEIFLKISRGHKEKIKETSVIIYYRSCLVAAFSLFIAMSLGYYDFKVLSDIYNAAFLLDYGLINEKFNYNIFLACQKENENPGEGSRFLKGVSKNDFQLFQEHPVNGKNLVVDELKEIFNHVSICNVIKKHHEQKDGKGFPLGLVSSELTDLETLIIFSDMIIPFTKNNFDVADGQEYLKKQIVKLEKKNNMFGRLLFRLRKELERFNNE